MNLSPSERKEVLELVARQITQELRDTVDFDELYTIELSTAAQLLGLSVTHAARVLPIIEVGPRTRRVSVADYKAFLNARRTTPKGSSA
jgi:hypothetical protein